MDTERVKRIYAVYSGFYDLLFDRIFHDSRATAIDLLAILPGERVLEVGVGTGLSLPLYPSHCRVVGIDLSASMLERGRDRVTRHGLHHVELHQMDAARMSFQADSFDVVFAAYSITAVPDPRRVILEMARTCKSGGRVVLLNHFRNGNRLMSGLEQVFSPVCAKLGFRSDLELTSILDGTSLNVERVSKVNPLNYWKIVECVNRKPVPYLNGAGWHSIPLGPSGPGLS